MALFSGSVGTHPFVRYTKESFVRVITVKNLNELVERCHSCIREYPVSKTKECKGKTWKVVPHIGDMVFISGDFLVLDGEESFSVNAMEGPIPVHHYYKILVSEEIEKLDHVHLRYPDADILDGWLREVTGSIKVVK
jgi:hypothetical protein